MKIKKLVLAAAFVLSISALTASAEETTGLREQIAGGEVKLTEPSTLEGVVTIDEKEVTIDLNGQTLTMAEGSEAEKYLSFIDIKNGGKLTIKDSSGKGRMIFEGAMYCYDYSGALTTWILVENKSALVIDGGTIEMGDPAKWYKKTEMYTHATNNIAIAESGSTIDMNGGVIELRNVASEENMPVAFYAEDGTVNFNDGTIGGVEEDFIMGVAFGVSVEGSAGVINVNGGAVGCLMAGFMGGGTYNITGGEISALTNIVQGGKLNISSGKLTGNPVFGPSMGVEDKGMIDLSFNAQVNISGYAEVNCDIVLSSNSDWKSYLNIDGGIYRGAISAVDCGGGNENPSEINISGGQINTAIADNDKKFVSAVVTGGTFAPECKDAFAEYVVEGKEIDSAGNVVDKTIPDGDLGAASEFVLQDGTHAGYFFNVKKAADGKTIAAATFTADGAVKNGLYALPEVGGEGELEFSILLLNVPSNVSGKIEYR